MLAYFSDLPTYMPGIQLGEVCDEHEIAGAYSWRTTLNHCHVFIWWKHR